MHTHSRIPLIEDALKKFDSICRTWSEQVKLYETGDDETIIKTTRRPAKGERAGRGWQLTALLSLCAVQWPKTRNARTFAYKPSACLMCGEIMVLELEYSTETERWTAELEEGDHPSEWDEALPIRERLKKHVGRPLLVSNDEVESLLRHMALTFVRDLKRST